MNQSACGRYFDCLDPMERFLLVYEVCVCMGGRVGGTIVLIILILRAEHV